jgi:hypothetical protein
MPYFEDTARVACALEIYLRYEAAVARHLQLIDVVQSARAQHMAVAEAIRQARASRADAASSRASLREAMRSEVAALRGAAVPPERVLRLIHDGIATAAPGVALSHDDVDRLRGEMVQWAIADYFAAA